MKRSRKTYSVRQKSTLFILVVLIAMIFVFTSDQFYSQYIAGEFTRGPPTTQTSVPTQPTTPSVLAGLELSVATMKDKYSIGQDVNLVYYVNVTPEVGLHPGWPVIVDGPTNNAALHPEPIMIDVNEDNKKDILVKKWMSSRNWAAYDSNGSVIPGWEYRELGYESPAVADIVNDSSLEIISGTDQSINILDMQGNLLTNYDIPNLTWPRAIVVDDLDNDGENEIIFNAYYWNDNLLYVIDNNMSLLAGWPKNISRAYYTATGNVNGDSAKEIIIARALTDGYPSEVHVYDIYGNMLPGWPKTIQSLTHQPALFDADNDGDFEIFYSSTDSVHIWQGDGSDLPGWPVQGISMDFPAIGKTKNGDIVLLGGTSPATFGGDSFIHVHYANGSSLPGWPKPHVMPGRVLLMDIDSDESPEVIVCSTDASLLNRVLAWDIEGSKLDGFPLTNPAKIKSCGIEDVDDDGNYEILVQLKNNNLYLYDLVGSRYELTMEWPMYNHDLAHTGRYEDPVGNSRSQIFNNNNIDVQGLLVMRVQKLVSGQWQNVQTIHAGQETVPAKDLLALDEFWNHLGWISGSSGTYRAYVTFEVSGKTSSTSYEFVVV